MNILIAEDDTSSRNILEALLKKNGLTVITAMNGIEAWEILQRNDAPRIALIDWLMPGIDGCELCRKIRSTKSDFPIYIIMLTIKNGKEDVITGLEAGANDYLSKPYDAGELYARINTGKKMIELETALRDRIDALKLNEAKIETLLAEKEMLLYEVHHRIKNNMNTVMNILTLQADATQDKTAEEIVRNASGRIKSMGVLYDKLYRAKDLTAMSIKEYLPALVEDIIRVFPNRYKVQIDFDLDDFVVEVQQLSCLGIITNEIITNAFKYAFEGKDSGAIYVRARCFGKNATVTIEDDGCGIPKDVSTVNPKSFGLKLIAGIAEQMRGTLQITSKAGTKFVLEFGTN